jgi:protein-S-isoprenylcysteine O-methyltransferase Ste14
MLLMASAVALFAWAARTMGDNWAIVARTRGDHQLVTSGLLPGSAIRFMWRWRCSCSACRSQQATLPR